MVFLQNKIIAEQEYMHSILILKKLQFPIMTSWTNSGKDKIYFKIQFLSHLKPDKQKLSIKANQKYQIYQIIILERLFGWI